MTRNPKIPHCIRDMDFSLRKISHPAHAGIRNDRKEGRNDKKRRVQGVEDSEKRRVQGVEDPRGQVVLLEPFFQNQKRQEG